LVLQWQPSCAESIDAWRFIVGLGVANLMLVAIFMLTM